MTADDTSKFPSTQEVRDWAMSKSAGRGLSRRGALPRAAIAGWDRAHPDRPYVPGQSFHGTHDGYTNHGCRCDRCLLAGRTYQRDRYADMKAWSA